MYYGSRNVVNRNLFSLYDWSRYWLLRNQIGARYMRTVLFCLTLIVSVMFPVWAIAEIEVHQELQETVKAKVLEVVKQYDRDILGTNTTTTVQELRIELLAGEKTGTIASLENDLLVLDVGDTIFVNRLVAIDGTEYFTFKDIERRPQLLWLAVILIGSVIGFAGWQGLRALIALGGSILAILFLLVPALLAGYDPALVSFVIASIILAVTLFVTHGFKWYVAIAYAGTMAAVAVSCVIAALSVVWMGLTGFSADASVYLNFATSGQLDLAGLLLGSIIIGLLGVLDDVAITQASVVMELRQANTLLSWKELYIRSVRVGRDHVGSLVNTLALAYVGAALPLILLYARSDADFWLSINQEVIAVELVRIMVGSIGLVLTVPLTSLLAAYVVSRRKFDTHGYQLSHQHHHH